MTPPVAIILAAGEGTRLGGVAKALLTTGDDESYLVRISKTAAKGGAAPGIVVVGGTHAAAVTAAARQVGFRVAVNPHPERGMSSSVAVGFAAALAIPSAHLAFLWPVDHPWVQIDTLIALQQQLGSWGDVEALIPTCGGRPGHPPLIRRTLWPQLAACTEEHAGARGVLARVPTARIEVDDPGVLRDVDEPGDR